MDTEAVQTLARNLIPLARADTLVYLHAGRYMIWNEERTAAKVTPAA
jgi:hypothetical protein